MKIIKTSAVFCEHCGTRLSSDTSTKAASAPKGSDTKNIIGVLVLVVGLLILAGIMSNDEPSAVSVSTTSVSADAEQTNAEQSDGSASSTSQSLWIVKSKDGIKARLKDPDSAEFRNVHFYSGSGKAVVCGEVNARNGFGGFTGFERFVASGEDLAILASDMASANEMTTAWNELCVRTSGDTE